MKRYLSITGASILAFAIAGTAGTYLRVLANTGDVRPFIQFPEADKQAKADVQTRLASAVDNAVSLNGYASMIGSFDNATRVRMGMQKDPDLDRLNMRIVQFRRDFKDKFNEEFNLDAAELAGIPVYRTDDDDHAVVFLSSFPGVKANAGDNQSGDIFMVREKTGIINRWRIVIPENVSSRQLCNALDSELAQIDGNKENWPADAHAAYKTMAGQILQTLTQLEGDGADMADNCDMNH